MTPTTPPSPAEEILACERLVKRFDDHLAIDHVSFEVHRGEIIGLLGPNGAGKTTLIRMILDIFKPDEGEIRFLGHPSGTGRVELRNQIGYLPEERGLYRRGRLGDVLCYLAELRGLSHRDARQRVNDGLEALGYASYATRRVIDLSKGMTQRVAFLVASLHRPQLLILDEPFSGLDPVGVQWALEQIRACRDGGATILLSAHQMERIESLCDRVVMVSKGRRVLYGTLDDIRAEHARDRVAICTPTRLLAHPALGGLLAEQRGPENWEVTVSGAEIQRLLERLVTAGVPIRSFSVLTPTLEEIFLDVVAREAAA